MKKTALIVAGGAGIRMGTGLPKQFIEIAGKPLLMHTIGVFKNYDPSVSVILVLSEAYQVSWKQLCEKFNFMIPHQIVNGGMTRFQSVKNGLDTLTGDGIVFIHDGVRPLVSQNTLHRCYEGAIREGNAIPVIPVNESVRWCEDQNNHPVDRSKLVLIQTPQTFLISGIQQAYRQQYQSGFTDDASVLESMGETIHLVEGNRENIKITWPEDLLFAQTILSNDKTKKGAL
jgi:2-C-methyl-D-erythritol 4-phosphate cytidylyltransferase